MKDPLRAEQRIAILAPIGRDAELTCRVLVDADVECVVCADIASLCEMLGDAIGAILIAEEALVAPTAFSTFVGSLHGQPPWSDVPVLLLTGRGADSPTAVRAFEKLGNVTLLERPLRVGSLVSNARAALRARHRQYQIREHLADRERSEEALRGADRRKDEFLATLAHELRNPLAPISNAAHLMRIRTDEASLRNAREIIERQVRQLARIVEDLLDVSRISHGKVELRLSRAELATVVLNAVEASQPLIADRRHEFTLELPPESTLLDVDAARLSQVISNLLNNAAKYTPRGGRISLTAAREGAVVTIRVRDSGIGIDASVLPTIFDMFVQADNRLERDTGGLGIGLTLVRHFVDLHGGCVEATSAGIGHGSEFVVTLPALEVDDRPSAGVDARIADASASAAPRRGLSILVVDDNRDSANSMGVLLQSLGNHVTTANAGIEALQRIAESAPDVALLDIGMPTMNGYEVAERIRSSPAGKDMLLIAVSGWGQELDRMRSRMAGFDHHLIKPVEIDTLLTVLAERSGLLQPPRSG